MLCSLMYNLSADSITVDMIKIITYLQNKITKKLYLQSLHCYSNKNEINANDCIKHPLNRIESNDLNFKL